MWLPSPVVEEATLPDAFPPHPYAGAVLFCRGYVWQRQALV